VLRLLAKQATDKANSPAPSAKLIDIVLREEKKDPTRVGVSRKLWARSDTPPAAIRIIFVYENRDMLYKRIAQKGHFFYHDITGQTYIREVTINFESHKVNL
jgi:hypothetical protein